MPCLTPVPASDFRATPPHPRFSEHFDPLISEEGDGKMFDHLMMCQLSMVFTTPIQCSIISRSVSCQWCPQHLYNVRSSHDLSVVNAAHNIYTISLSNTNRSPSNHIQSRKRHWILELRFILQEDVIDWRNTLPSHSAIILLLLPRQNPHGPASVVIET